MFGTIIYVNKNATGQNNGTNWPNAFQELNIALPTAQYGDEIWVAKGTYSPYIPQGTTSFYLGSGIHLLGGFNGNETSAAQRNWQIYETVLSGNGTLFGNPNVVYCAGTDSTTLLDGFTIRDGLSQPLDGANCDDFPDQHICFGGAIYLYNKFPGAPTFLTVRNCRLVDNDAAYGGGFAANFTEGTGGFTLKNCYFKNRGYQGGALHISTSTSPQYKMLIDSCFFNNNKAFVVGGISILNQSQGLKLTISNSIFKSNIATWDAGTISVQSGKTIQPITIVNCWFDANEAGDDLGWPGLGAALLGGNFRVESCIFTNNRAYNGGVIHAGNIKVLNSLFENNLATSDGGALSLGDNNLILNCTFYGNRAVKNGGAIVNAYNCNDSIANCIFINNRAGQSWDWIANTVPSSRFFVDHTYVDAEDCMDLQVGMPNGTLICGEHLYFKDTDPLLRDTLSGDFRLTGCSPLLNAGDPYWTNRFGLHTDLAGNARVMDSLPDIGAYETQRFNLQAVYSDITCFGANNGIAELLPSGGFGPYSYQWASGQTGASLSDLVPGAYHAVAYDDDLCIDSVQFIIEQPEQLVLSGSVQNASGASMADGAVTLQMVNGGITPYTYIWSNGSINGTGITGLLPGVYTATVSDKNDCSTVTTFEVGFTTGIAEPDQENIWSLFPNPASDWLLIKSVHGASKKWHYQCYNEDGITVQAGDFTASILVDVRALPAGVYFFNIDDGKSKPQHFKVIVE